MSAAFQALYYPSWNPPVKWLRSMLLFFDKVNVIRPEEVLNPGYHTDNVAVFDLIPQAFGEIRKKHYGLTLNEPENELLKSTLDCIASERPHRPYETRIDRDGRVDVTGCTLLHVSKIPNDLYRELESRSLIIKDVSFGEDSGFHLVDTDASNLILSFLANQYGSSQGLRTLTDKRLGYVGSVFNTTRQTRDQLAVMNLAANILKVSIPDEIEKLNPQQYVDIRSRYEELREPFQHMLRTICDDYMLAEISSKGAYEEAVRTATRDFYLQTTRLHSTEWGRRIKKWGVISLGALSSFCTLGAGTTIKIGAGISASLHVYQGLSETTPVTEKRRVQQLIGGLRGEIIHPTLLRRVLIR